MISLEIKKLNGIEYINFYVTTQWIKNKKRIVQIRRIKILSTWIIFHQRKHL